MTTVAVRRVVASPSAFLLLQYAAVLWIVVVSRPPDRFAVVDGSFRIRRIVPRPAVRARLRRGVALRRVKNRHAGPLPPPRPSGIVLAAPSPAATRRPPLCRRRRAAV